MNTTEIAALATPQAIIIWNSIPEVTRRSAMAQYGTKENAIAELAMSLIREVAKRIAA